MLLTRNDKRRLGLAALGSLAIACLVAALLTGPSPAALASVPPPGSPEVTRAFQEISVHVEQKPLPPGYRTTTVSVQKTPPETTRTVVRTVHYRSSWWTRGPVRRFVSAPFRLGLFRRWRS